MLTDNLTIGDRVRAGYTLDDRPSEDDASHATRRQDLVIEFLGVEPGMSGIDVYSGGGYATENLAHAVGVEGSIIAQNNEGGLDRREGVNRTLINKRLAGNRLPQVTLIETNLPDLTLDTPVDFAFIGLNVHDINNFQGYDALVDTLTILYTQLKPGGFIGITDHAGRPDVDNTERHRIDPEIVYRALQDAGFTALQRSSVLANPNDDYLYSAFDERVRGKTDRFVVKASKPNE